MQFHSFLVATSNAMTSAVTALNTGFQTQSYISLKSELFSARPICHRALGRLSAGELTLIAAPRNNTPPAVRTFSALGSDP